MEYTHSRRRLSAALPPSPLLRSRSTTPANARLHADYNSLNNSLSPNSCHSVPNNRPNSASISKSRATKNDENVMNPSMPFLSTSQKIKPQENVRDNKDQSGFAKFLQRRSSSTSRATGAAKGAKSVTNSPSAWALSPGRSPGCRVRPDSTGQTVGCSARPELPGSGGKRVEGGGVGAGVVGVLKYFKQRKVSPPLVEEFHRFRVIHNRLLQWRFVNTRGEAAMAGVKRIAEMFLLNEWSRLERRNQESVSSLARKLLGLSVRLPLVQGAKADVVCLYEVLTTAMGIMDSIEAMIVKFFSKIETALYLLTELRSILEQEDEYLVELEMAIPLLRTLLVNEESVQIHLIQAAN